MSRHDRPSTRCNLTAKCSVAGLVVAVLATACYRGTGEALEPKIDPLPEPSFVVTVRDLAGLGVTNAFVSVNGSAASGTVRDGRADVVAGPIGQATVLVNASMATAEVGDLLASVRIAGAVQPTSELGYVIYLPDLRASVGLPLTAGALSAAAVLNDAATSGAVVTFAAGTAVSFPGGQPSATVRSGAMPANQAPPAALPGGGLGVFGIAIAVDPLGAGFVPGGQLSAPNDLGLADGAPCSLLGTDPVTGDWELVASGTAMSGRLESAADAVRNGGLYMFAAPAVGAPVTIMGRVLDQTDRNPLGDVLVRAGNVTAITVSDGTFLLSDVSATDAAGAAVDVDLILDSGRYVGSQSLVQTLSPAAGSTVDVNDVMFDTGPASEVRLLLITRGAEDTWKRIGVSSGLFGTVFQGVVNADAEATAPVIAAGWVGFQSERPANYGRVSNVFVAEGLAQLAVGSRSLNLTMFSTLQSWWSSGSNGTLLWTMDAVGLGLVQNVMIYRGSNGVDQFVATTTGGAVARGNFNINQQATAAIQTAIEGRTVSSAFTVGSVGASKLEMPLERALRAPRGRYVPFGRMSGVVAGTGPAARAAVRRMDSGETWLDGALSGGDTDPPVPIFLEPSRDGGLDFDLGVPATGGNLVTLTGTATASGFDLATVQLATQLQPPLMGVTPVPLSAPLTADVMFGLPGALTNRDSNIAADAFVAHFAASFSDGRVVDIARGLDGNVVPAGDDVNLALPPLSGPLAGASYLVLLEGRATDANAVELRQTGFHTVSAAPAASATLLSLPAITMPAVGASVPAAGFSIEFTAPADADYLVVRLHRDDGTVVNDWTALLQPTATTFTFRTLPTGPTVLTPGDYRLSVSAERLSADSLVRQVGNPYWVSTMRWVGIAAYERQLEATSSVTIPVVLTS